MPEMDGLEVLRKIKDRSPSLPVIMVTASDCLDHAITALCEGADDFVRKPVNFDELQLCVTRTLTRMRVAKLPPQPPPGPGWERRKAPRVCLGGEPPAHVQLKQLKDVSLIDLSRSGALVEHTEPVRTGEIYCLSFSVGGSQVQVLARAVRAYASHFVTPAGGERQLVFRTGMEFVGVEKAAADLIAAHVEHLLKEPGRGMGDGIR
jgi:CheY-like chemotaxis protein